MRDLYEILGVPKTADQDTIKKAFKKLARENHPDKNPTKEAEARFKEANAANSVLGDEEKRKLYDEFGEISLRPGFNAEQARAYGRMGGGGGGGGQGFPGFGGQGFSEGFSFEDLFGDIYGGGGRGARGRRGAPQSRRGADMRTEIEVELLTALRGGEISLRVSRPTSAPGEYGDEITTLKVQVPEGVDDGQVIRLRGKGHPGGGGGPPGDVLLEVKVLPHPLLRRKDRDLELDVPITIGEAVNGGKITVPTPWGAVNVNVPPMCRNGSRLRLRGKGVHGAGKDPGDLTLVLRPTPPSTPSDRARELAASFDELYDKDVRADLGF